MDVTHYIGGLKGTHEITDCGYLVAARQADPGQLIYGKFDVRRVRDRGPRFMGREPGGGTGFSKTTRRSRGNRAWQTGLQRQLRFLSWLGRPGRRGRPQFDAFTHRFE